jgi:GT2 family glycosyltransferase
VNSLIVPHMPFPESDALLKELLDSVLGVDERLIIVNDGIGFGAAVNIGFKLARGDYFIVANNDTKLINGTLRSLPDERGVTVPYIEDSRDDNPRCFYCMPRWVYDEIGGYDEQFEIGYWEDDDLIMRLKEADIPIFLNDRVEVSHFNGGGLTVKRFGEQELFDKNKERFIKKWHLSKTENF